MTGVKFYLEEHPELLSDLLLLLSAKMENSRTIHLLKTSFSDIFGPLGVLPLCKSYLVKIQEKNLPEVRKRTIKPLQTRCDCIEENESKHRSLFVLTVVLFWTVGE